MSKRMEGYRIYHGSGVSHDAWSKTLTGAKREASREMTHGGGSVSVVNVRTGEVWTREFWSRLSRYGWTGWKRSV